MPSQKKHAKKPKKALDSFSRKRGRGRPLKVNHSETRGRADNFRFIFDQVWDQLWPLLSKAQNVQEVLEAFHEGARTYEYQFIPAVPSERSLPALILKAKSERSFPKRRKAQVGYLADSIAAHCQVELRTSRDLCAADRKQRREAHHIIRHEYWVECSCGYRGRSRDHACAKCGAKINGIASAQLDFSNFGR